MAFIDTFAKYHTLSKYPVDENTSLANVRNKSGHTVTTGDIWSSEIPAFFVVYDDDTRNSLAAVEGDLCKQGSQLYEYKNGAWATRLPLTDGEIIGDVIKYHKGCKAVILTDTNNSGTGGNGYSVRIRPNGTDATAPFIESFISSMDKVVNGIPSMGYNPVVHDTTSATGFCDEGTGTNEYIANCYGGVITFNTKRNQVDLTTGEPTGNNAEITITIDCFEYIGDTLNETIKSISSVAAGGVSAVSAAAQSAGFSINNVNSGTTIIPTLDIATATITDGIFASTTGNKAKLVTAGDVENYVATNAKVSVNGTSATKITVNGTTTGSNDLVKVVVTENTDTDNEIGLTLTATVDVANVNAGVFSSADANKLVTAIDAEEIATNVIDKSINSTDANTIGGKIKDIKDTVDDIENALSGVAQVVNDLELSTTQAISDAITESKNYTDDEIDKVEKSISDALTAHGQDIAKVEAAIEGLTTTGLTREVLADGQTTASITNPQANVIYLVKDSTSETGAYVEYLYVNGDFEAIGTTSTDLSEYVKSVKINGSAYPANSTNKGALDLGTVVTGLYNTLPSGVTGVGSNLVNASSVYAGIANGKMAIGVADASTTGKGLVQLSNSVSSSDTSNAITGKGVSEAISSAISDAELTFVDDRVETASGGMQDLCGTTVTKSENTVKISHNYIQNADQRFSGFGGGNIKSIVNNVAFYTEVASYATKDIFANIQTDMIRRGRRMCYENSSITLFDSDLISLTDGQGMFENATNLKTFYSDLSSVTHGDSMFSGCTSLERFGARLNNLIYGYQMFKDCSKLTEFKDKKEAGEIQLTSLKNGSGMFYRCTALEIFKNALPNIINGSGMFIYCENLSKGPQSLNSLVIGGSMFYKTALASFDGELGALKDGYAMFGETKIKKFDRPLPSLINSGRMFYRCSALETFTSDLSSVTNGESMFASCNELTHFTADLSSLINGVSMFKDCSKLTEFTSDLSSLISGYNMFESVHLNMDSVELICDSLPYKSEFMTYDTTTSKYIPYESGKLFYQYPDFSEDGIQYNGNRMSVLEESIGTITISFATDYINSMSAEQMLEIADLFVKTANEKGWTFITNPAIGGGHFAPTVTAIDGTIQTYIYVIKHESDEVNAKFIDEDGNYWTVDTAEAIIGPNVKYWSIFPTEEDAIAEWKLTPYVYVEPVEEETPSEGETEEEQTPSEGETEKEEI